MRLQTDTPFPGIAMDTQRSILIEFPPAGDVFEAAASAVANLDCHLGHTGYSIEPLVRVHGRLVEPFSEYASAATTYAYRIHLAPMPSWVLRRLRNRVLSPLEGRGAAVQEQVIAA